MQAKQPEELNPTVDLRKVFLFAVTAAKYVNRGFCPAEKTLHTVTQIRMGRVFRRNYFATVKEAMAKAVLEAEGDT